MKNGLLHSRIAWHIAAVLLLSLALVGCSSTEQIAEPSSDLVEVTREQEAVGSDKSIEVGVIDPIPQTKQECDAQIKEGSDSKYYHLYFQGAQITKGYPSILYSEEGNSKSVEEYQNSWDLKAATSAFDCKYIIVKRDFQGRQDLSLDTSETKFDALIYDVKNKKIVIDDKIDGIYISNSGEHVLGTKVGDIDDEVGILEIFKYNDQMEKQSIKVDMKVKDSKLKDGLTIADLVFNETEIQDEYLPMTGMYVRNSGNFIYYATYEDNLSPQAFVDSLDRQGFLIEVDAITLKPSVYRAVDLGVGKYQTVEDVLIDYSQK